MRGLVKLAIGVVVLGGVLVGADRAAVGVAEGQAADRMVSSGRVSTPPQVRIEGFPFLTQVAAGDFQDVRLSSNDLVVKSDGGSPVSVHAFSAQLTDVQVADNYRSAMVRHASGSGLISYQDVARLAKVPGLGFGYGGPGKLQLTLVGQPVAVGEMHTQGNLVIADHIQLQGLAKMLGESMPTGLLGPHSFTLNGLPAGLTLAGVTPQPDGLQFTCKGDNVNLM